MQSSLEFAIPAQLDEDDFVEEEADEVEGLAGCFFVCHHEECWSKAEGAIELVAVTSVRGFEGLMSAAARRGSSSGLIVVRALDFS